MVSVGGARLAQTLTGFEFRTLLVLDWLATKARSARVAVNIEHYGCLIASVIFMIKKIVYQNFYLTNGTFCMDIDDIEVSGDNSIPNVSIYPVGGIPPKNQTFVVLFSNIFLLSYHFSKADIILV